jgi:hypothetical protein
VVAVTASVASTAMSEDPAQAPHPTSDEFDGQQNTAERVSPGTTADAVALDPDLVDTDPGGGPAENTAKDRTRSEP